jgi:4'-phosphopantetheinyl transferase
VSWLVRRHHGRVTTYTGADPETLLAEDASEAVTVRWHDVVTEADAALRMHVAAEVGVAPESVTVGRLCGRCGSPEHGRPWASHGVHVSLARSGPHLVTAVSTTGPVGVDVECVENVDRAWRDLSAAMDLGTPALGTARTALWCRIEAALKQDGSGFAVPFDPQDLARRAVDAVVAPDGYCAAVACDPS